MMNDYDRVAELFTPDGLVRMPHANVELVGWEQMRAFGGRRDAMVEYFVQNTHPGAIRLDGDPSWLI
jgi:hypothetical protein